MRIAIESANQPEVIALIERLDAYQKPLYPAESHHGVDIATLCAPNVLFAVARNEQGRAVACGAIVLEAGYGELKRMFTDPEYRGRGIARTLLSFLEAEAQARGCTQFMLETGYLQPEALAMYQRAGYVRRGPFGDYKEDPNSVFMHKYASGGAGMREDEVRDGSTPLKTDARTRFIDATPAQVFAALRDPQRLARWWGPKGFSSTIHEFGFHPGATWRLTLHGPDGSDYPNVYRVLRIEPDRLLEVDHPSDDHHFVLTLELSAQGSGTLVSWRQTFDSEEHYRALAGFLAQANEQVLSRLAAEAQR